jgi:hypothetical protein
MARGPTFRTIHGGYGPAPTGFTYSFKVTTAVNTLQRLGTLLTIPAVPDEIFGGGQMRGITTRPPNHVEIGVPVGASQSVWVTIDNNTAPVVGGPGIEIPIGTSRVFEGAGEILLQSGKKFGDVAPFTVNALTAFQIIALLATAINITFYD